MKSLQNLSYKTLFTIFFLAIAGIIFFLKIGGKVTQVSASWWNDSWHYRKSISINNTGGTQSNVYLTVSTDTSDTTKFQADCGDIRFTDQNGSLLDYYIVSGCGTTTTVIHTNFPTLISGNSTFYLYYGNSSADNGFSTSDFTTAASSSTPSLQSEETGGGPIAYWKFDEGVGTTAYDSAGSNNSTLSGTTLPEWQNEDQCISGKCLNFKGLTTTSNSQLTNNLNDNISNDKNFTMSAWINLKGAPYLYSGTIISAGNWNTTNGYWTFGIHYAGGIYDGPQLGYGAGRDMAYTFNLNQWYFVTWVSNSGTNYFYLNGKYINSSTEANYSSTTIPRIGQANYGPYFSFNGLIDDLKIYPYARTADQIKLDYNSRGSLSGSSANLGVQSSNKITGSAIQFGSTTQNIGGTTTSLDYCIPGDTNYCAPPVAEWKMDEGIGTSIIDTSGNSNTGTFGTGSSAPTWAQGKIGKGLSFNGTSNFISTNISSVPTTFTMSSWIKLNTLGREQHFIEFNGTQFYVSSSNKLGTSSWSNAAGTTTLTTNRWYYATLTRDSSEVKLYLNGVFEGVGTSGVNPTSPFVIGDLYSHSGNYKFSGSIDQVKIYNYVRTPAQIAYDYNKGGPVGWWKMDECQGSTIYDWSGNGNNGTLTIGSNGTQNSIGTCQIGTSAAWTNGASGKINSSLNFDGTDDYVTIPSTTAPKLSPGNFTISFWTYRTANGLQGGSYISKGTYTNGIDTYDNIFRVNTSAGELAHVTLSTTLNKWEHHLFSVNQTSTPYISHYINGILNNTGYVGVGNTGTYPADNYDLIIGKSTAGGVNRYFNGQIDDVRIYNYALTEEQIKQVYNNGAINFQ